MEHHPVLLAETVAALAPRPGETMVDLTAGRGGHAAALAEAVAGDGAGGGTIVLFDLDAPNLAEAARRVRSHGANVRSFHDSFARAAQRLRDAGLRADGVLADLGFSSTQMDDPQRGFSFSESGPLDMRYHRGEQPDSDEITACSPPVPASAARLIATCDETELARIIGELGEEPLARKIARKLVRTREETPIETTAELARLVVEAYGGRARSSRLHPATRTFMALRIAVNAELAVLRLLLESIARGADEVNDGGWLQDGARVAIISFHSLEDRLVKRAFAALRARGVAAPIGSPMIRAAARELQSNPRSRSAKLRAVRIGSSAREWTRRDDT